MIVIIITVRKPACQRFSRP